MEDEGAKHRQDEDLKEQLDELDNLLSLCFQQEDAGSGNAFDGKLTVKHVVYVRQKLAEACFHDHPEVAFKAARCLLRVLSNSPVGDSHVACGLLPVARMFISNLPTSTFEGMPLALGLDMIQCVFFLLEAVQAEHLIGNLPAISQETRDEIWDFCENLRELNTRASKREVVAGLADEAADISTELWLETLLQLTKHMKTPASRMAELGSAATGALSAAIKLYKGDLAAGLSQLKGTFSKSSLLKESWFEDLLVLRRLVADAVKDEATFRQLKWIIQSGRLHSSVSFMDLQEKPRFLMHVILGLRRLIERGCSSYVRRESFQLLIDYVLNENFYLQFTAAQVLERLCESDSSEIKMTATILLVIAERVVLSQASHYSLRDYAVRLRAHWDGQEEATNGPAATFSGYLSVVTYFFEKLNEGKAARGSSLVSIASGLSSHHAGRVMEAMQRVLLQGQAPADLCTEVDKATKLTPVHQASQSGIAENLLWMIRMAGKKAEQLVKHKLPDSGRQPIHLAGSIEVLNLLLKNKADLAAKDNYRNTVLHTLTNAVVLDYILREKAGAFLDNAARVDLKLCNSGGYPPLFMPRNYDVTNCLLEHAADLHERVAGETALINAAQNDNEDVCRALIEARAEVAATDSSGKTALSFCGIRSFPVLVETSLGKTLNQTDKHGNTALFNMKHPEVTRQLCELQADVNHMNKSSAYPLTIAPNIEHVQYLIQHRADPSVRNLVGDPIFLTAVMQGKTDLILHLAQQEDMRMELFMQRSESDGLSVAESLSGSSNTAYVLSTLGYDSTHYSSPNPDTGGLPMARKGIAREFLRRSGIDITDRTGFQNEKLRRTFLHTCEFNDLDDVTDLLKQRADAGAVDALGQSVLCCAIRGCASAKVIDVLLQSKASPSAGCSAVLAWAEHGQPEDGVLELLLSARGSVNEQDGFLRTPPLCGAVSVWDRNAAETTLDVLVRLRADAGLCDALGQTPLTHAVRRAEVDLVRKVLPLSPQSALLEDVSGMTPAMLAEHLGYDELQGVWQEAGRLRFRKKPSRTGTGASQKSSSSFLLARMGLYEEFVQAVAQFTMDQWRAHCPLSGQTLLQSAIQGGSLELVKFILKKVPDLVEMKSLSGAKNGATPLVFLASASPVPADAYAMALELVNARADIRQGDSSLMRRALTFPAAESGNHGVLKLLLEHGLDANATSGHAVPAICGAITGECVNLLIQHRAELENEDLLRRFAAQKGSAALRALLPRVSLAAINSPERTPLFSAFSEVHVQQLLQHRADVNLQDSAGRTALHRTAAMPEARAIKLVQALLDAKCDAQREDRQGRTALSSASAPVAKLLVASRADISQKDHHGVPCALACARDLENLQTAFAQGVSLDIKDPHNGLDLALVAAGAKNPEPLKLLLQKRADIFASKNDQGRTFLHRAMEGHLSIVDFVLKELLRQGRADARELLTAVDDKGASLAHVAVERCFSRHAERSCLDRETRQLLAPDMGSTWKLTLLLHACRQLDATLGEELVNMRNREQRAPIDGQSRISTIETLLDARADPTMALVHLGNAENLEVVDLLLSRRADINAKNPSQSSASQSRLHSMVRSGDVPLLQAWADRKADLHCVDEHGDSLLACARHAHMLEFLMDHKLDVNRQSHVTGNSLLHVLVEEGNLTLLKHLLNLPQVEASLNAESQTLLHVAAKQGRVALARFLMAEGFSLHDKDREGCTPLHLASKSGHYLMVQLLIEAKADANAADDESETPLMEAIRSDSIGVMLLLLENRADAGAETDTGRTALHVAAANDSVYILNKLLQMGLDVNRQTTDLKRTVLHTAVLRKHGGIVDRLLECQAGLSVGIPDTRGDTAITLAAQNGAVDILDKLCGRASERALLVKPFLASVEAAQEEAMQLLVGKYKVLPAACRDSAGNNALHLCSRSGNHTMAGLLLEQWGGSVADALTQLNAQGQTPREIASIQNFGRILRSFNAHCARHEIKIFEGHVGKPRAASSGLTCFPFNVCCIAASSEALEFQF